MRLTDVYPDYSHADLFPHPDECVLHAPNECLLCDRYPERQALRHVWRINFTGGTELGKQPCPAEVVTVARDYDRVANQPLRPRG
jgi:hypothetical protein